MKKIFSVIFILTSFLLGINFNVKSANASEFLSPQKIASFEDYSKDYATTSANEDSFPVEILSKSAYLMDVNTGKVVYSNNETAHLPIASMCKIMTLNLCFEAIKEGNFTMQDKIPVSSTAAGMGGSQVFLEAGGDYTAEALIKSITVASANDACVAMAEKICGSENAFVDLMNEKAKSLGMNDTVFVNCTGLPKDGQFSCAKDVAIMFKNLIKFDDYFRFSGIWMDKIEHPEGRVTEISNTNKLIRFYEGCDAGKTGYTKEAGHCLASTAKRNGMRLISIIISAPNGKERFKEASDLFNFGFANYVNKMIIDDKVSLEQKITVKGAKNKEIELYAEKPFYAFSAKNQKNSFEITFEPKENVKAPLKAGEIVGKITVFENGIEIGSVNAIVNCDVEKSGYFDNLKKVADNWSI